ncbi:MAG: DMT family transporter [Spirochaetales bacterium]|nr:DMT family transporter [Spirochaetales bacterium]
MRIKDKYNQHLTGIVLSSIGIILLSFDTVLIRLASASSWNTVFWRCILISVTSSLILFARERTTVFHKIKKEGFPLILSGMFWGFSGLLFVVSVKMTVAANVLVMLSLSPLFAGIAGYFFLGERIGRRSLFMIAVAASGVYIIFAGDIEGGNLAGNLLGLLIPVCLGINLAWMRKHSDISRTAAVITGGLVSAFIASFFAAPFSVSSISFFYLVLLGLIAIPLAQLLLSTGTRYLPASRVALIMMSETFLGPLWVWAFIGEIPPVRTFAGGALILAGVFADSFISIIYDKKNESPLQFNNKILKQ